MSAIPRLKADATVDDILAGLDSHGCAVVEHFLRDDVLAALRSELEPFREQTPVGRNDFEGFGTRRIYNLFAKVRGLDELAIDHRLLGVLDATLGLDYQLSGPVGIDIGPHEVAQIMHCDDVVYPLAWPHQQVVFNTMWAFDDFTVENGATMIVPGSHHTPPSSPPPSTEAIPATMPAGSVLFYVGTLWHHGGANQTDQRRFGVILEYVAGWLRAQENHVAGVPKDVMRTLPKRLQQLLGYNIYPPFLGYVDGRDPLRVLDT